jgi:MoaA/NifB/PqqE/SkfB family radical SAM enzyme
MDRRRWRLWQIETAVACNLDCVMCPWKDLRQELRGADLLPSTVWEALVPHLPDVASVDFTGSGEPLLHPSLFHWMGQAREAGCRIGFLTNGTLLDGEACRRILDIDTDWVGVSLDGARPATYEAIRPGASFETVTGNIRRLAAARSGHRPRILLNMVMMRENVGELEEVVQLASALGADRVIFKQCDVVRGPHGRGMGLFGPGPGREVERHQRTVDRARRLARKRGLETDAYSFVPEELPVCDQDPRLSLFIRCDGVVAPCISLAHGGETTFLGETTTMPAVSFGRLPGDDLAALWRTPLCRSFRETFAARVEAHDRQLAAGSFSSIEQLNRAFENARRSMIRPPDGCDRCHYLYGL